MSQTYPALPINELFAIKRTRYSLWRWLPASLALHALILMALGLAGLVEIAAVLPVQSGRQSVDVRLVSAASLQSSAQVAPAHPKAITTADAIEHVPVKTKKTVEHEITKTAQHHISNHGEAINKNTSAAIANLPEGVYSEATPQSSHKPEYPRMAILKNQQGKVVIKLDIDQEGISHNIQIIKSSGFALLDNAVIAFAKMERFIPAKNNNSPVKTTQQYSFLFKLI